MGFMEGIIKKFIRKSLIDARFEKIDKETKEKALKNIENPSELTKGEKDAIYKKYIEEHFDEEVEESLKKMKAGLPHSSMIPDMIYDNMQCRKFLKKFNSTENTLKRSNMLKGFFKHIGKNVFIETNFKCEYGYNISIDDDSFMNADCMILDNAEVTIGKNCWFGPRCELITAGHPIQYRERRNMNTCSIDKPIRIGNECWFGASVIVLPGVTIGNNVVVGAGSVVTKDVPSNTVVCGNPARPKKQLDPYVEDEVKK